MAIICAIGKQLVMSAATLQTSFDEKADLVDLFQHVTVVSDQQRTFAGKAGKEDLHEQVAGLEVKALRRFIEEPDR